MHDLYYKGRIHTRLNHVKGGYNTNRDVRLGTVACPLTLTVKDETRKVEITLLLSEHQLVADIIIDDTADENITQLATIINKPGPTTLDKTPGRNDPCSCDSGKKYKKCCG